MCSLKCFARLDFVLLCTIPSFPEAVSPIPIVYPDLPGDSHYLGLPRDQGGCDWRPLVAPSDRFLLAIFPFDFLSFSLFVLTGILFRMSDSGVFG